MRSLFPSARLGAVIPHAVLRASARAALRASGIQSAALVTSGFRQEASVQASCVRVRLLRLRGVARWESDRPGCGACAVCFCEELGLRQGPGSRPALIQIRFGYLQSLNQAPSCGHPLAQASNWIGFACGVRPGLSVGLIPRSAPVCRGCVCWSVGGLQFDSFQLLCCVVTSHRGDVCPRVSHFPGPAFVRAVGTLCCSWVMPLVCPGQRLPAFAAPSHVLVWCSLSAGDKHAAVARACVAMHGVLSNKLPELHVLELSAEHVCRLWSYLAPRVARCGLASVRVLPLLDCLELVGGQQGSRLLYTVWCVILWVPKSLSPEPVMAVGRCRLFVRSHRCSRASSGVCRAVHARVLFGSCTAHRKPEHTVDLWLPPRCVPQPVWVGQGAIGELFLAWC